MTKPHILILCTGNSCRSQMAEGLLRAAAGDLFEIHSAGSKPLGRVQPKAIAALKEIGIDISGHESKHMDRFLDQNIDTVITVCGNADAVCPMFPGQVNQYHWGFDDPAHTEGDENQIMVEFRRVRDQMKKVFEAFAAGFRQGRSRGVTLNHKKGKTMNEQTKELIAIGVSIAAHCQPCLKYHYAKASELGVSSADIRAAIDVGHQVEHGAGKAMREFHKTLLQDSTPGETSGCCGGDEGGASKCC